MEIGRERASYCSTCLWPVGMSVSMYRSLGRDKPLSFALHPNLKASFLGHSPFILSETQFQSLQTLLPKGNRHLSSGLTKTLPFQINFELLGNRKSSSMPRPWSKASSNRGLIDWSSYFQTLRARHTSYQCRIT